MLEGFDANPAVRAIIITGSERAFAAGADIKEMALRSYMDMFKDNFFVDAAERIAKIRKPVIAAVAGYALGGGCELAMMCDFIIAADSAKFGQPEITLGVMPGMGGSQRLTRFVGKSKAMDMCLTGRMMDAAEAERSGLVSRVVPAAELMAEAMKAATKIAEQSLPILMMTKETVNQAYETTLAEGLRFERRVSRHVRNRGPEGRHGRFQREAEAPFQGQIGPRIDPEAGAGYTRRLFRTTGRAMPNIASAKKRVRTTATRTLINHSRKTRIRGFIRKVEEAITSGDMKAALAALKAAEPEIMRGVSKGVIHKNTGSRKVSRLSKRVTAMGK